MKPYILSLLFSVLFCSAMAQQSPSPDSTESRFFVGIGLNITHYPIMGEDKYLYFGGIKPFVNINYGYRLSKRATIQLGIGYGANEINGSYGRYVSADTTYEVADYQHIRGIVLPVTLKLTPFNPNRRLQLYANASLAPIFGHIKAKATESFEGTSTVVYDEQSPTFDIVATAGLTLNYKISKRLEGYMDGILYYKNLNFQRPARRFYENKSVGIGINYNL
ncbi:outer membrane beta-barrel protein [Pontibacter sp. 172403-2]|uniref:outer membrane beta-barrel protein n=1 Tax=Pontibacter rufus TaxID=2791028 RepID=UPI0018AFA356|nr:outer membrane beta-barrel protein [Pontibacter sp. 172403-2]MBF9255679.1 outer membrane beta-barrel protein [Pontibacter sp. 172403-2]